MPNVLIADDDSELREILKTGLEAQDFDVDLAVDGFQARQMLQEKDYDLLVLDWMMPGPTGVELCQWCRDRGSLVPILLLSGRAHVNFRVEGLDSGADDYLTKPFSYRELVVRLKALIRRCDRSETRKIRIGPLTIDPDCHSVSLNDTELRLTRKEFSILELLARYPGEPVSVDALVSRIWESPSLVPPSRVSLNNVRVYVKRLRQKLQAVGQEGLLVSVYGVGYRLEI